MSNPWQGVCLSAVEYAAAWLDVNGVRIPESILSQLPALKFKPGMGLPEIEDEYNTRLYSALDDYTQTGKPITQFRNAFRRTISDGMNLAALAGWSDSGGEGGMPEKLQTWVNQQISQEIEYADGVFDQAKEIRKTGTPDEVASWIKARADGYTGALSGIYGYSQTFANPDKVGRWVYGDTIEHCETDSEKGTVGCAELEGQEHPLSWWRERGYIPRQRGNDKITCGGWRCQCSIVDVETGDILIPMEG